MKMGFKLKIFYTFGNLVDKIINLEHNLNKNKNYGSFCIIPAAIDDTITKKDVCEKYNKKLLKFHFYLIAKKAYKKSFK